MARTGCVVWLALTLAACTAKQVNPVGSHGASAGPTHRADAGVKASGGSAPARPDGPAPSPSASRVSEQANSPAAPAAAAASASDLARERTLLDEAEAARKASDYAIARAKATEAIDALLAREEPERDGAWLELLDLAGRSAWNAQDARAAKCAWSMLLEVRSRTCPDEHPDLQRARSNLASTFGRLGDHSGARPLFEKVLEVYSRTLPDEHPDLQRARLNLATTFHGLGDLRGARGLQEKVLEVFSRTLPDDHPDLQWARGNLANSLYKLGDLQGARTFQEKVLEVRSRTLPDGHPDLQWARGNLAVTLGLLGDHSGARVLEEKVLEVRTRTLPDEHRDLQAARLNLANTIRELGDHPGARTLEEKVLEVFSRTLPDDHHDLQAARLNLAETLRGLGDLQEARALLEKAVEVYSRTLPDDHPSLQRARVNLAVTIKALGDLSGARTLQEKVFAVWSRALPNEHPDLQLARLNLASTLYSLGDLPSARALVEIAVEVSVRTLPDENPELQRARLNLAATIAAQSFLASAGVGAGSRDEERERCVELLAARCASMTRAARTTLLVSSQREAEARCRSLAVGLDFALSVAAGIGAFPPSPELEMPSFVLSEATRGGTLSSAAVMRLAADSPRYTELRRELEASSEALASLASKGTTSETFREALARRESVERELVTLGSELSNGKPPGFALDVDVLAGTLSEHDAIVAYRRFKRKNVAIAEASQGLSDGVPVDSVEKSLCVFVLRRGAVPGGRGTTAGQLTWVQLGPIAPIEEAVRNWRAGIGAGLERGLSVSTTPAELERSRGEELRKLVLDPLRGALGEARRLILVLDDVLHLVPIDALPLEASGANPGELVGDRWRVDVRCTSSELLAAAPPHAAGALVAFGGASFNSEPLGPDAEDLASIGEPGAATVQVASILRGGAWERGFDPLPHSGPEALAIAALHAELLGADARSVVLEKRRASRESLEKLAPRARWLHVATHGWFAPESIRSWSDPEPLDKHTGLGMRPSGEEQVKGMSPMLMCGLALAGANLPENTVGRAPGLITAGEIAALDLTNCELAVLSACDTNVGEHRAGQGVASFQMALQMAGTRSAITSLWRVPDEATRDLMTDFYRRLWAEKKPKRQALWEAKRRLREAKDESGRPKYSTRDWAAWVLTGDPD